MFSLFESEVTNAFSWLP